MLLILLLQSQIKGLSQWMEEMELFLKSEEALLGDTDTLHLQLQESKVEKKVARSILFPMKIIFLKIGDAFDQMYMHSPLI